MNKSLEIQCAKTYHIHFSDKLDSLWDFKAYSKVVLITDNVVAELYAKMVCDYFPISIEVLIFPAGEAHKTRETKQILEDRLLSLGFGRDGLIIALGGGVVLDLAGFLAATYCRGVDVIYMPTSLLAMVDASIGGKTAVNTPYGKNMIGAFSQPRTVFINTAFLKSLPFDEFKSGLAEVIKHALILDNDFLQWLISKKENLFAHHDPDLLEMIYRSCKLKAQVVMQDEFEQGIRQILNFGHTIAHAIETHHAYQILHGQAVAIGMLVEAYIAYRMGELSLDAFIRVEAVMEAFEFDWDKSIFNNPNALKALMLRDKKNKKGQIRIVMLKALGQTDMSPNTVSESLIDEALSWAELKC